MIRSIQDVINSWREADSVAALAESRLTFAVDAYVAERGPAVSDLLFAQAGTARAEANQYADLLRRFKLDSA